MIMNTTKIALIGIAIALGIAVIVMSAQNILDANEGVIIVGIGLSVGVAAGIKVGVASHASFNHGETK